jgi:hypothetical protein
VAKARETPQNAAIGVDRRNPMKTPKMLLFAVIPLAFLALSASHCDATQDRGVKVPTPIVRTSARFDPKESVAVFVGIRRFDTDPRIAEVRYAADDAVDLAYALAIERNASLVPPEHVRLAISGEPVKTESKARLKALLASGAKRVGTDRVGLLQTLQEQARQVGRDGIFIASFATHGFSSDGVPYVLASTSLLNSPETSLSTASLLETIGTSAAARSLVLIDACRQRLQSGTRATGLDLPTGAPLIDGMKRITGQVVLYAATAGNYAYDDDVARNGVFTAAILDSLRCKSSPDSRGLMTVEMLASHAEERVKTWMRRRRHPVSSAIQLTTDGATKFMPLAMCGGRTSFRPESVRVDGSMLTVFGRDGRELWHREVTGRIHDAKVAELDGNKGNEVIVSAGSNITVFRPSGEHWWTADSKLPVSIFQVAALTEKDSRIFALSSDAEHGYPSHISVYAPDGLPKGGYASESDALRDFTVAAPTARHQKKLIVTGDNSVLLFEAKEVEGEAVWHGILGPPSLTIKKLKVVDYDNDGIRDLALYTSDGYVLHLDFEGKLLGKPNRNAQFELLAR